MRALLVPVKSFREAKHRLEGVLGPDERARLARRLGAIVLAAAGGLPAYVACDDSEVADWAIGQGAMVLWTPGLGLSGAVMAGVDHLGAAGCSLVVVAHADLPFVGPLEGFGAEGTVTLAPDWRHDGTNVAAVPASAGFSFSYGPASFSRHVEEAARLGIPLEVVDDPAFARDVDLPEDLEPISWLLEAEGISLASEPLEA